MIVDSPTSTLSLNRSDTFTFDGTLSGPGTLAQIGSGISVLTSADNSIGATTISAGTLQVDGGLTTATVDMTGTSALTVNGTVQAGGGSPTALSGDGGVSTITVNAGAMLAANGDLGDGADTVSLAGTLATSGAALNLGLGNDTLILRDSGAITGAGVEADAGTDALVVNNALALGLDGVSVTGFESLTKQNSGVLTLTGDHDYSAGTTITAGTLRIGNGGLSGTLAGDIANDSTLEFNRSGTLTIAGQISGTGALNQISPGTTILTGANSYTGATNVDAGTLLVNGDQSAATGPTTVNLATLGGIGIIGGDVAVTGGVIAPGSNGVGTLTINGGLSLDAGSILEMEFGEANVVGGALNDLIEVGGDLVLDGTINVTEPAGGSFDLGIYRVINYSGSLTDNGLDLGTLPVNSDVSVQTSVANQVNLVYGTDPGTDPGGGDGDGDGNPVLNFWDGDAGPKFNDAIDGGDGLWQNPSGNDNWTTTAGDINAAWTDSAFAIFTAAPGTVMVDNSLGDVAASGMQFAVDGYTITGDTLTLVGPNATIRVGDGTSAGTDMTATIEAELSGSSQLVKTDLGTLVLAGDSSGYAGSAQVAAGTLAVNGALGGMMDVLDGGRLEGTGQVGATVNHVGGTVAPGFGDIGTLTIGDNYTGNGGVLEIEAVLGGDNSPADKLVIGGDTSGTTPVTVINRGGLGAQTEEGIKIIDVAGASDGTFTLVGDYVFEGQQAVVAGAYAYRLHKNGIANPDDGDWYLRSALLGGSDGPGGPGGPLYQPGAPLYEAYSQTLLALNGLPTMQERVGNRQWARSDSGQPTGIWGRIEGVQLRPETRLSTSGTDVDIDSVEMQIGMDHALVEQADGGILIAGITAQYGRAQGDVSSLSGSGRVKTQAYGLGTTLTWYGPEGFYVDGQARLTWFDSDLRSSILGSLADGNDGRGEAASLEAGKRIGIGRNLAITPQVQAVYSNVRFDTFTDPFEAEVGHDRGDSLRTRLGVSIDHQGVSDDGVPRSHLYGIINVTYEWLDGTRADVGGVPLTHANERLWGELGLGGSVRLSNGLTLYGQVSAGTPLAEFGDGYSLQGTAGLRMQF